MTTYTATKARVANRGCPPDAFLGELVAWGRTAPDEIFAPNAVTDDIYTRIKPQLGPWQSPMHRRAAMLEALRVLAGFESSWNWNEGRDMSVKHEAPDEMEAGAWQVSANSMAFGQDLKDLVSETIDTFDPWHFQTAMKLDHPLACAYIARLLRHTVRANGPVLRNEINPWLSRDAVAELEKLLA
jgi:hypothetical protein